MTFQTSVCLCLSYCWKFLEGDLERNVHCTGIRFQIAAFLSSLFTLRSGCNDWKVFMCVNLGQSSFIERKFVTGEICGHQHGARYIYAQTQCEKYLLNDSNVELKGLLKIRSTESIL